MIINNITVSNIDINGTTSLSFTIADTTENVDIYLKINENEYFQIFTDKTNETLTYNLTQLNKGVNNLSLKLSTIDEEYISETFRIVVKDDATIEDLNCSYSDGTGKFILSFLLNGDIKFSYTIYLKIDNNEYREVLNNQISGEKTIEGNATIGNHTAIIKVSDGYDEYTFNPLSFEVENHNPILSNILITNINNDGTAVVNYSVIDIEGYTLTHILSIDGNDVVINPTNLNYFYTYNISNLSVGNHSCKIKINDTQSTIESNEVVIKIFNNPNNTKEQLEQAKTRYDDAYNSLKNIISNVINDMEFNYELENDVIQKAQENYNLEYANFNKICQQSIDIIGTNKVNLTKEDLEGQIDDVSGAVGSLEETMNTTFKDGILSDDEKNILKNNLNLIAKEKADIDSDYNALYNNEDLLNPSKTNLKTHYDNFVASHNTLVTVIDNIINKTGIIDNTDKTNADNAFVNWRTELSNYRNASLQAIDSIAKKKADDSSDIVDKKWAEIIIGEDGIEHQVGVLNQKNEEIEASISTLTQTAEGFELRVSKNEEDISSLTLSNSAFEVAISGKADSSNIISIINASTEGIAISSNKVNISGFVTFSDLSTSGTTTINGSNITTGTIDASDVSVVNLSANNITTGTISSDRLNIIVNTTSVKIDRTGVFFYKNNQKLSALKNGGLYAYNYNNGNFLGSMQPILPSSGTYSSFGFLANGNCDMFQVAQAPNWTSDTENTVGSGLSTSFCVNFTNETSYFYTKVHLTNNLSMNSNKIIGAGEIGATQLTCNKWVTSYSSGTILMDYNGSDLNINPPIITGSARPSYNNSFDLGTSSYRYKTIYSVNTLNSSDKQYKENIEYLTPSAEISAFSNESITLLDMYNFIKNDVSLAKYNYINQNHEEFGFIADDIANTKIGRKLIIGEEGGYQYSIGSYIGVLLGTLQYEINIRDNQIKKLENRIIELENKINDLK